nr:hypothetical protein [Tanacetum cinerariifolium]
MEPTRRTTKASPATTTTTTSVNNAKLKALIDQGVANALAARDADRSRNSDDSHDLGTCSRRTKRTTRECTYTEFIKCQPMNFKGTEGVVVLTQCFERMKIVFNISNCAVKNQVKFATCTLYDIALTWWKSHVKTVGQDAAHIMPRGTLMKIMTAIMFPEESDKIEKYVGGLPDMIHGSVMVSKPKTMQDAVEFATELMDKKIRTFAKHHTENKRKQDDNQQQQNKRQNTGSAYTAGLREKKPYGDLSRCTLNETITMMVRVLLNATSATENQGHYRSDCPELKNQNNGNQAGGTRARGMVHALGGGETNQDLNNMEDDINA